MEMHKIRVCEVIWEGPNGSYWRCSTCDATCECSSGESNGIVFILYSNTILEQELLPPYKTQVPSACYSTTTPSPTPMLPQYLIDCRYTIRSAQAELQPRRYMPTCLTLKMLSLCRKRNASNFFLLKRYRRARRSFLAGSKAIMC